MIKMIYFNPGKHTTLIKKLLFCFLHGILYNVDFLSFCKFPFGANLGAEKYRRKYEKNAQQHVRIPNGYINSFNMGKKNESFNSCMNIFVYVLCSMPKE